MIRRVESSTSTRYYISTLSPHAFEEKFLHILRGPTAIDLPAAGALPQSAIHALSSLGMLLPSSPGAIGVYEAVTVAVLRAHDMPHDQALAAALFAHMAQFIPVTLSGGLVILFFPRKH